MTNNHKKEQSPKFIKKNKRQQKKKKKRKKEKRQRCPEEQKEKKKKKKQRYLPPGRRKKYINKGMCTGIFVNKKNHSTQFSLHLEEKTFWWIRRENTCNPQFIFLSPHLTKHTSKKFYF